MDSIGGSDMKAVGIRELKNRLTHYVRLAKQGAEIVITEHGRPVALIQRLQDVRPKTQSVQLAKLGAEGRLILPSGPAVHVKRVQIKGPSPRKQLPKAGTKPHEVLGHECTGEALLEEACSRQGAGWQHEVRASSIVAYVEMHSALSRRRRSGHLTVLQVRMAADQFIVDCQSYVRVPLPSDIIERSARLV